MVGEEVQTPISVFDLKVESKESELEEHLKSTRILFTLEGIDN